MSDEEKLIKRNGEDSSGITATELKYVIDVNKKAIELYVEIERQNEEILNKLDGLNDNKFDRLDKIDDVFNELKTLNEQLSNLIKLVEKDVSPKVEESNKNLFRLLVFLGILGAGIVFQVFEILFKH